jgi:hypothetical protein
MTLSESEIQERIEEGHIRCLITFEVAGKPKEHVDKTLEEFIEKLKQEKALTVIETHVEEAAELEEEEGFFSAFAEVDMLLKQLESLTSLSINMMPASVEILEPGNFKFPASKMQNWLNDMISQLHTISTGLRTEKQRVKHLSLNMGSLLRNFIAVLLAQSSRDSETLARITGVPAADLGPILEQMEKEGHVKKEGEDWILSLPEK